MRERNEAYYREALTLCDVPVGSHDGLVMYLVHHIRPGGFLQAVLSNDLLSAWMRADVQNARSLHYYVSFLHRYAPGMAWGSPDRYREWLEHREKAAAS